MYIGVQMDMLSYGAGLQHAEFEYLPFLKLGVSHDDLLLSAFFVKLATALEAKRDQIKVA